MLPLVVTFASGLLGGAWLCRLLLIKGTARTVRGTLRLARVVLFLKASSYFAVLAACVYMYEGRNPAASLLCWLVMSSAGLDHAVFDPAFAAIQMSATVPLLLGMHRSRQGAGLLDAAPGFVLSERLPLVVLLALAQAKVRRFIASYSYLICIDWPRAGCHSTWHKRPR